MFLLGFFGIDKASWLSWGKKYFFKKLTKCSGSPGNKKTTCTDYWTHWRGAGERRRQLASLQQRLTSWPVNQRGRCLHGSSTSSFSSGFFLLYLDADSRHHAHIPSRELVQCWRDGLHHSVKRQTSLALWKQEWRGMGPQTMLFFLNFKLLLLL